MAPFCEASMAARRYRNLEPAKINSRVNMQINDACKLTYKLNSNIVASSFSLNVRLVAYLLDIYTSLIP